MELPVPIGALINDRYLVERVLGEGGMGVVALAKHRVLDQKVAIKFLRRGPSTDAEAVQRFVREAQAAAKLTSQYVARVHDVAVLPDGTPYIVMEYLEGQTLAVLLGSGPLAVRDVTRFALQMCEVLAETHAAGIVHGDLKPENIYIAGTGDARRVKLLDFGVSKITFEDPASSAVVMGTPSYMAPEQLESGTVTPRADIFAFGCVLYEMLTAKIAFDGANDEQIKAAVRAGMKPIERTDLPPGLEALIRSCVEVEPTKRPLDALSLAASLEPFAPAESSVKRMSQISAPVIVREAQKARRSAETVVVAERKGLRALLLAMGMGLTIAGIIIVVVVFVRRTQEPIPTAAAIGEPPPPTVSALPSALVAAPSLSVAPPPPPPPAPATTPAPAPTPSASAAPVVSKPKRPPRKPVGEVDRFGTRK